MDWEKEKCHVCGGPVLAAHVCGGYIYQREDPIHVAGGCYCRECAFYMEHPSFARSEKKFCFQSPLAPRAMEPDEFCSRGKIKEEQGNADKSE